MIMENKPRMHVVFIGSFLPLLGLLVLTACRPPAEQIPAAGSTGERPAPVTSAISSTAALTGTAFDLENCAAAQGVTRHEDQLLDNRTLCYQARAEQRNDWSSCLALASEPSPLTAQCLAGVTLRSQSYVCAKGKSAAVVRQCNELLMIASGADPNIHQIDGLQEWRIVGTAELQVGDNFNVDGMGVIVSDDGLVVLPDYYPATSHVCRSHEDPPLAIGTGIQGAYVYVTGCTVTDNGLTINYFRYDLPGLSYPAHL